VKIFDYAVGKTGLTPRKATDFPYQSSLIIANSNPGFYPEGSDVVVTIYFNPENKQVMGAEVFGKKGIDKRIDVLATAIYAKLTIYDLQNLDLAYAPPFSPAKDPIIVAAYAGENEVNSKYNTIMPLELEDLIKSKKAIQIIDVRNPNELEAQGQIEGAINIPLDDLRERLGDIEKNQEIYIYCARGLRGYLASKILEHNGFQNINNLSGGFMIWGLMNLPKVEKQA
jgi:rhodanese-related sulfurtransferase